MTSIDISFRIVTGEHSVVGFQGTIPYELGLSLAEKIYVGGLATREASLSFIVIRNHEYRCILYGKIKTTAKIWLRFKNLDAFLISHKDFTVTHGLLELISLEKISLEKLTMSPDP